MIIKVKPCVFRAVADDEVVSVHSDNSEANAVPEEENYSVEEILDKRVINDVTEYYLKWNGFPHSENTWEPKGNLDCPELIAEFEEQYEERRKEKLKVALPPTNGFDRGLEPDQILGATDACGELLFLVKWKDCDEADLIQAKVCNIRCPMVVIKFYEERLRWGFEATNPDNTDNADDADDNDENDISDN